MKFNKNYVQFILALLGVLFTFAWFGALLFITIPEKNEGNVNTFSGALITVCLGLIFNYYYGSSKGSQDKTDILNNSNT
jgi:hypothetical protein